MRAIIDNNGLVTVQFERLTPNKVRALVESIKLKYGIKGNNEFAKLFNQDSKNGSIIAKWCMNESKSSSFLRETSSTLEVSSQCEALKYLRLVKCLLFTRIPLTL